LAGGWLRQKVTGWLQGIWNYFTTGGELAKYGLYGSLNMV
jgi:hypothetical protein